MILLKYEIKQPVRESLALDLYDALTLEENEGAKVDDEIACPKCEYGALEVVEAVGADGTSRKALACNNCPYLEKT